MAGQGKGTKKDSFEDLSSYSSSREQKQRKKSSMRVSPAQMGMAALCAVLVICGSVMIYIATCVLSGASATKLSADPAALGIDLDNPNIVRDQSIKNIAVFGVDMRNDSYAGNADMVMILTIDNKHDKVKMTSILRDSQVMVEGDSLTGSHMELETKISEAYLYGGPDLAVRTLNTTFGLNIMDYVTVNFANMAAMIDAIGGVDVEVTAEETREININLWNLDQEVAVQIQEDKEIGAYSDRKYPVIAQEDYVPTTRGELLVDSGDYVGGLLHLNGNRAVAYGRIRDVGTEFARVLRLQTVFLALLEKVRSMSVSDLSHTAGQLLPYCETSLGLEDIEDLALILKDDFVIEGITVPNVEYESDVHDSSAEGEIPALVYDLEPAARRVSSFINEELSPYWSEFGNTVETSVECKND